MTRPRVLLADDHRLLREAFAQLLESECDVVGVVADGRAVLAEAPTLQPDIVVLDVAMPLLNGLDTARQLRKLMPDVKLIFLTVSEDPEVAAEAFRVGAAGFLLKNSAASELLQAIREVSRGQSYITPLATRGLLGNLLHASETAAKSVELSTRQREVLQLLAEGHTMKEIARVLKITPRTVAFHKYSMMELLGVKSSRRIDPACDQTAPCARLIQLCPEESLRGCVRSISLCETPLENSRATLGRELPGYLAARWDAPAVVAARARLTREAAWTGNDADREKLVEYLNRLMDSDSKTTGLKELQGLVWAEG